MSRMVWDLITLGQRDYDSLLTVHSWVVKTADARGEQEAPDQRRREKTKDIEQCEKTEDVGQCKDGPVAGNTDGG